MAALQSNILSSSVAIFYICKSYSNNFKALQLYPSKFKSKINCSEHNLKWFEGFLEQEISKYFLPSHLSQTYFLQWYNFSITWNYKMKVNIYPCISFYQEAEGQQQTDERNSKSRQKSEQNFNDASPSACINFYWL